MDSAHIVVGLCWGDEGKGSIVDFLVRETGSQLVVRFSGGPQCAHNVVTPDGVHHCFAQFGSGTLAGAQTLYAKSALFEPYALYNEAEALGRILSLDPLSLFHVEAGALIITPFHWITNRLREKSRGDCRHGSCGMGVGEARKDELSGDVSTIRLSDLQTRARTSLMRKLLDIQEWKIRELKFDGIDPAPLIAEDLNAILDFYAHVAKTLSIVEDDSTLNQQSGAVIFEGNQGVLLDEKYGEAPNNTWTDCTFTSALRCIIRSSSAPVQRIGVLRTYATRHGAGPFPAESSDVNYLDHNGTNEWQGDFRQGFMHIPSLHYALAAVDGIDGLAMTHMDRFPDAVPVVTSYKMQKAHTYMSYPEIEDALNTQIVIESRGPAATDKRFAGVMAHG